LAHWLIKFADDTKIYRRASNVTDRISLQKDLDQLTRWSQQWGMKSNVDMCKAMHLGSNNVQQKYYIGGNVLGETSVERDLGVLVYRDLKSNQHCLQAYRKAQRILGIMRRTIKY
jgi:ribonucleases P/MRP protein subunit RPP40